MRFVRFTSAMAVLLSCCSAFAADEGTVFFEKHIRPVLVNKCYSCHSAQSKDPKGGLLLDTREGIRRGGDSGHGVVPGKLDDSLIIGAIKYEGFEMPPKEQLSASDIANFEKWVTMGAPDPREGKSAPIRRKIDFEKAKEFWSFQPLSKAQPPVVKDAAWPANDIDRFVLAKQEEQNIRPVADAEPHVLVRRLYFDLTGLPPTPEQVDDFVADPSAQAWEALIDKLLASPQFGERWGRHWMDVVRFAESTGMERNYTYPHAWRYRDYVIAAMNADVPFDQFIQEQIAGDLLPASNADDRKRNIIATGMLALGPKSLNERNKEQFAMDIVDEQIDVVSRAFLGLTASCARCHDHKFDPIPQKEYYALAGIFRSTNTFYGTGGGAGNRQAGELLTLKGTELQQVRVSGGGRKGNNNAQKKLNIQLRKSRQRLEVAKKQAAKGNNKAKLQVERLEQAIARFEKQQKQLKRKAAPAAAPAGKNAELLMGVADANSPADTALRIRGEVNDRGDSVPRGFLTVASFHQQPQAVDKAQSGRKQLADWIANDQNPLTARVAVNRIWSHLFGRGLVTTVNNFGANGERPTHPELLDFLARQFTKNGWSRKSLIKQVLLSRTYRLAAANGPAAEVDPGNALLWRANHRRLEAESLRDAMLAASGELDLEPASKSIVAEIGDGNVGRNLAPERFERKNVKRSVYLPIVRGAVPELLRIFDFPEPSIISGARDITTVPTQALYMMNSEFVVERSQELAKRVQAEAESDSDRIAFAYRLTLSRMPTEAEMSRTLAFIGDACKSGNEKDRDMAWTGFCQTLFASAEFRYVE